MFKLVNKLNSGLSRATIQQNVLSNNLANFNTPGFKRSDVVANPTFSKELNKTQQSKLSRTNARHLSGTSAPMDQPFSIVQDRTSTMRNDGNNVDPDRERVLLLENQLYYDSLIDAVSRKLGQLRSVIGEGRR